jgi:hypothetical protein
MGRINDAFLTYAADTLADTSSGLSGTQIVRYFNSKSVDFAVDTPYNKLPLTEVPNKRTAFLENLRKFSDSQQFSIIDELTQHEKFKDNDKVKDLRRKLYQSYSDLSSKTTVLDTDLVKDTTHFLQHYPKAHKCYISAIDKYRKKIYERNLLDDLRLSLELLLKEILGNERSLENQLEDVGKFQKSKNMSSEIANMFGKLLDYYSKYQNNYVKHNDAVKSGEIDFIFNLTTTFMSLMVGLNR